MLLYTTRKGKQTEDDGMSDACSTRGVT
jgi:hypothetical protein